MAIKYLFCSLSVYVSISLNESPSVSVLSVIQRPSCPSSANDISNVIVSPEALPTFSITIPLLVPSEYVIALSAIPAFLSCVP